MAIEVPKKAREDVEKLQQYQQQLQLLTMQKQQLRSQILEIEHSLEELDKVTEGDVYEIIGNVMVKKDSDLLKNSLNDKKQDLDLRLSVVDKQVDKISNKTSEIQKKVMKMVKG